MLKMVSHEAEGPNIAQELQLQVSISEENWSGYCFTWGSMLSQTASQSGQSGQSEHQ